MTKAKTHLDVVREYLDPEELLTQLAEEATELAKAALKLRRAYSGINPTPVTSKDAFEDLMEEIADVANCLTVLGFDRSIDRMRVARIGQEKMARWANRLEERHG